MQNFCILAEFSKLLAYWLLKGMQNFCMLSNSSYLCNRRSAVFLWFYRVQNFCILNMNAVNFWSILTTEEDAEFLHLGCNQ